MYYHNQINNYENSMYIYLPIAEQPIHSLVIIGVGLIIGFIMGLVGVGGGFLLTPIMMFLGIPPPVAVASVANGKEGMLILRWELFYFWGEFLARP
jgi:hypothetical protein